MLERKNNIFKGKKEVPKLYAGMFKDNRNPAMGLKLKTTHTEGEIYEFKKEFEDNIDEAWGFCLLGFFSGALFQVENYSMVFIIPGVLNICTISTIVDGWYSSSQPMKIDKKY